MKGQRWMKLCNLLEMNSLLGKKPTKLNCDIDNRLSIFLNESIRTKVVQLIWMNYFMPLKKING